MKQEMLGRNELYNFMENKKARQQKSYLIYLYEI